MDPKPLLFGLIGFFLGGLVVSVAATTFEKPAAVHNPSVDSQSEMSMSEMTQSLRGKKGDAYDKQFIQHMIEHHQSAVEMAQLSAERAQHDGVKQLSHDIIIAQRSEIQQMRQWQQNWDYKTGQDATVQNDR